MKSQVALEYLIMVALSIMAVTVIYMYIYNQQQVGVGSTQADVAANSIKIAADNLYAQGPGAKTQISVVFPDNYLPAKSKLENSTIIITITSSAGESNIVKYTKGNISGSLPTSGGTKYLNLILLDTGVVNVTSS